MLRSRWQFAKDVFSDWNKHEAPRMGAALAFYSVLSLSPLLVLAVAIASMLFSRTDVMQSISSQVESLAGPSAASALQSALGGAQQNSDRGIVASAISILVLLFSASGVFGELRSSLNKIWEAEQQAAGGFRGMLRERIFSFGMVLAVGFLLLVSLLLSAALAAMSKFLGNAAPFSAVLSGVIDLFVSLVGVSAVFALMFRYVPEAKVRWRQAWVGGLLTGVLFTAGKWLLGMYLAKAAVGSAYGAAGSVVVVIVWIYYTAQIVFLGAEFTHLYGAPHRASPDNVRSFRPRLA